MQITRIRTTPLSLPYKEAYHWSGGCPLGATVVLVEVETDAGITGIGESTGDRSAEAVVALIRGLTPLFIGEAVFDVERLLARAFRLGKLQNTPRFGNHAFAGLELALWDAIGKAAGQPVHRLFGGQTRREIDYFAFLQGDEAEALAEDARSAVAQGYAVVYLKVGRGERKDLDNVRAVRREIGDRKLRVDANEAWDVLTAVRMIRKLSEFDLEFVEQPTASRDLEALAQVKAAVNVPIAIDQGVYTPADVYEACRRRVADVIVLGPHETGGLLGFRKAAAVAEAAGLSVCLHGQHDTGISTCAENQIGTTLSNLTDGNQIMHQLLVEDLVASPDLTVKHGKLPALGGIGLGFDLDRDVVGRGAERYREQGQYYQF